MNSFAVIFGPLYHHTRSNMASRTFSGKAVRMYFGVGAFLGRLVSSTAVGESVLLVISF